MLSNFKIKKQYLAVIFIVSLLAVFLIPNITNASGDELAASAAKYVGIAVAYLLVAVIKVLGVILGLGGWLMDQAVTFRDLKTDGVVKGWEIMRDLVNMFFILVLLVVAFATVLSIEKYSIKAILPRLIAVALLINFSLPLVYVVVDSAQIVMFGFYNAMTNGMRGSCEFSSPGMCFSNIAGVANLVIDTSDPSPSKVSGATDAWQRVMNLLLAIIFLAVYTAVVVAGGLLLIVRIVGIWIAAIFSPLAIFSRILPGTSFFYNTWMKKFLQYTFFGPLYVFFLWISLILLQYVPNFMDTAGIPQDYNVFGDTAVSKFVSQIGNILQFIMVIVLLLWSFLITRQLGIKYGDKIATGSEKFLKNAAWTADRAVARGEIPFTGIKAPGLKRAMPYLSYGAQKRAWAARKQEAERSSYSEATGAIEDKILEYSSIPEAARTIRDTILRKPKRHHQRLLRHQGEVAKKQNEISSAVKDENELVSMAMTATDPLEKEALYRQMAATNAFNTFFYRMGKEKKFETIQEQLQSTFKGNEGARVGAELAAIAIGAGDYTWAGMTDWKKKRLGRPQQSYGSISDHENAVKTKMRELEPQRFMAGLHPDSVFGRNKKGDFGNDITTTGTVILKNMNNLHLKQFDRMQGRDLVEMIKRIDKVRALNKEAADRIIEVYFPQGGVKIGGVMVDITSLKGGSRDKAIMEYVKAQGI